MHRTPATGPTSVAVTSLRSSGYRPCAAGPASLSLDPPKIGVASGTQRVWWRRRRRDSDGTSSERHRHRQCARWRPLG